MNKIRLFLPFLLLLLGGCDMIVEAVSDTVDEAELRQGFITACAEQAQTGHPNPPDAQFGERICTCAYEEMAQSYPDRETWKKTLIRGGFEGDSELMKRGETAVASCLRQTLLPAVPESKTQP